MVPVFAFSYEFSGNYYSGRFALSHSSTDPDELIRQMIGRKLQIRYNPSAPETWFIPDEQIAGGKVEQNWDRS